MKVFEATKRDNERGVMRLELSAEDIDLLEGLVDRLERLEKIEEALEVVAVQSPFILGTDIGTVTKEGRQLIQGMVEGWGLPTSLLVESE